MVEELKLAIKVDDDAIEQSLLKQFANAEKMANKVVLTFNNIDLDDKAIEAKFKEMQKMAGKNPIDLSIDKSSIEMLSAISKQLGNIFDIAKGKSIIDSSATVADINKITQATKELNKAQTRSENIQSKSFTTKNKTEAYNQLKQMADVFKQFYGNEEAMHTKAGTEAAYAYYKAYEEALKKGVAQSRLESVTIDVNKDGFSNAERVSSTRIKDFESFKKYGGDITDLSAEILSLEGRLLDFSDAYTKVKANLGDAPITPDIIRNIEDYVELLDKVRYLESFGDDNDKDIISDHRNSAQFWLDDALFKAKIQNEEYISSLKEVKEEKEKLDLSLNKSQTSDVDSSVVEQQNKIQEELKETQKQAEKTNEALSDIVDGNKSNISSPTKDVFQGNKIDQAATSAKELDKTLEQIDIPTDSFDDILSKLDLAKSELGEIVKITKQSVSDSEGKFHDSYTLKDKRGSTEIYGLSSNTEKGQLLRSNIVGYDAKEIEKANKQILKSEQELQAQKDAFHKKNLTAIDLEIQKREEESKMVSSALKTQMEERQKQLSSMESGLKSYQDKVFNLSIKPDDAHRFPEYQAQLDSINKAIKDYETHINSLQNKGVIDPSDIDEANRLEEIIKNLLKDTKKFSSGDKGFTNIGADKVLEKINSILEQNSRMSKTAKDQIKAYYNEIYNGNPTRPLNEILDSVYKIVQQEREAGRAGKSWLEIFKDKKIYSFIGQAASMFSFYDLIRYGREGIDTLKEFDDGLTKISYTMDMTKSQLNDLGNSVLDMASDMKSSIDDAMQVAQIYANMQTSAEEIQRLSEPTLILSNLSGFDSSTIADDIQAVTQQFDILAEDSMHIADVYDYISRNIAVDYSKGLNAMAEGLQVAGATAKQAGLSYEQTASIIAKAVEKTRLEGSQVGNGLKTIMTRLSKVGELSEEVNNETLSQASESLKKVGIEVYNLDGSYREFDVIMGELAGKWDDLTDAEKSNISFNIAATRQTNLLSAVLSNFSDSMQLAEEATNANGSALENQQKYMESFSGHLQSLETEAKIAWLNILDSETLKDGVDLLTGLVKVVGQLVDTFGLLGTAAGIGGLFAGIKNVGQAKMWACLIYAYPC